MPVAGCDVGDFRQDYPAEVKSALMTDVADRESCLAARPRELEVSGPLLEGASWTEPVELDLGQRGTKSEQLTEFHDHKSPGCSGRGEGTHCVSVVGAYHRFVDELGLPVSDGSSRLRISHNENVGSRRLAAFPAEVGEHGVDRGVINFLVIERWRLDWWRLHGLAPGALQTPLSGPPS